ncbi:MAG TPA: tRNA epoxyqueuosine(34) reductase QueG [Coleofasciculaceae cyanobacterium]
MDTNALEVDPAVGGSSPEAIARQNTQHVKTKALALGFHQVGIAALPLNYPPLPEAVSALQRWLDRGFAAQMAWMAAPKRFDARQFLPGARSVICVALNYYSPEQRPDQQLDPQQLDPIDPRPDQRPNPQPEQFCPTEAIVIDARQVSPPRPDRPKPNPSLEFGKIARYAWGRDYHRVLESRLKSLAQYIHSLDPTATSRWAVDSSPVQDKAWAQEAGLGWIAKNGNLITRQYGSWVFLGELFTSLELLPDRPHTSHCGTCTRCMAACPTGAIPEPSVVDANRCIAYHTIENRADTLPPDIAQNLQGWVAGCDICQDVCPWNQRFAKPTDIPDFQPRPASVAPRLADLATLSDEAWDQQFRGSALRRIKPAMWRRNARASLKLRPELCPTNPPPPATETPLSEST